jgi:hypothetical protein
MSGVDVRVALLMVPTPYPLEAPDGLSLLGGLSRLRSKPDIPTIRSVKPNFARTRLKT